MKKKKLSSILAIIAMMLFNSVLFAQPTITFKPNSGTILTEEDVVNTLAECALTRPDTFNTIIIEYETIGKDTFGVILFYSYKGVMSAIYKSVTKIDKNAFGRRLSLISIDFSNVPNIGESAFADCTSLASINFPFKVANIDKSDFSSCRPKVAKDKRSVRSCKPKVVNISRSDFSSCRYLVSIDFPNVTNIVESAFKNCTSLASIDFSSKVANIGKSAFENCTSLVSINFPKITNIGAQTFYDCNSLVNVRLGTDFAEPTKIINISSKAIVLNPATNIIHLTFGKYVLPERNDSSDLCNGYYWKNIEEFEIIKENSIHNLTIAPNPTPNTSTLTMDLEMAGNLIITLNDLLGNEIFEMYNEFTQEGTFTKPFLLETLPKGTYFLKIKHNGNIRMEKLIKE